jgi:hypothetical protein
MADEPVNKPDLKVVPPPEDLDEDEQEFRAIRRDLPGVAGASCVGIVSISVAKIPGKNEFFRTHKEFCPVVPIVDLEVGMERTFFAVTDDMVEALAGIGITVSLHTLYLTVTADGAVKIVPVRRPDEEGYQNEYARTKEIGLELGMTEWSGRSPGLATNSKSASWVRLYTDLRNKNYKVFSAPKDRFPDPIWPELKHDRKNLPPSISRQGAADRQH